MCQDPSGCPSWHQLRRPLSAGHLLSWVRPLHNHTVAATTKSTGLKVHTFEKGNGKETKQVTNTPHVFPPLRFPTFRFTGSSPDLGLPSFPRTPLRTLDSHPQPPLCGKAHHGRWSPKVPSVPGPISLDVARGNKHPLLTDGAELKTTTSHSWQVAL